jgi:hypothetical protein
VNWINWEAWNLALLLLACGGFLLGGIRLARRGRLGPMRSLPGVAALAEAAGRAAELGRPVFYVPGVRDLDNVQTIASLSILRSVAELTAQHRCDLNVPTDRSLVMNSAREICREGYAAAGRPEAYHDEMVSYVTDEQFAYAAKVDGLIARERPAAVLLLGAFYAESLLLAEAGRQAGAYMVAGTAEWHQLPFLVAACDQVLIGEELFAASAYLTRDPTLLGTLRGQDLGKYLAVSLLVGGSLLGAVSQLTDWSLPAALHEAVLRLLQAR